MSGKALAWETLAIARYMAVGLPIDNIFQKERGGIDEDQNSFIHLGQCDILNRPSPPG